MLSFYLGIWLRDSLTGKDFFSLENQLPSLLVAVGIGFFMRYAARKRGWV